MGDKTAIEWCDSTFNAWWGCTKIAPGCDNCYAAIFDKRTGGDHWNSQKPRRTLPANWRKPLKWNEQAEIENRRHRVFCGSMMDWCDKNAPADALHDLWDLIRATPMLDWQLLTKRATLIESRLPGDWGDGYDNVWLGVTYENQEYGQPRITALSRIPARVKFVSAEPLIGNPEEIYLPGMDWVIIGGESGPNYRPMEPDWAYAVWRAADNHDIPVFFKQWGGNTKDKGGCLFEGRELKQWPRSASVATGVGL
ncbi:MAG: phage Gp37/Gp68 family protein [Halioglobus sp.]